MTGPSAKDGQDGLQRAQQRQPSDFWVQPDIVIMGRTGSAELGWGATGVLAPSFGPQPLWKHAGSMLGGEVGS
jgi:hypothetical protein